VAYQTQLLLGEATLLTAKDERGTAPVLTTSRHTGSFRGRDPAAAADHWRKLRDRFGESCEHVSYAAMGVPHRSGPPCEPHTSCRTRIYPISGDPSEKRYVILSDLRHTHPPVVSESASSRLSTTTILEVMNVLHATLSTSTPRGSHRGATIQSWGT